MRPRNPYRTIEDVGRRIKAIRRSRNYTQAEFAERASVSVTYVQMVERGTENMTLYSLIRWCNLLQIPPTEVFKKHERKSPKPGRPRARGLPKRGYKSSSYRGVYARNGRWHAQIWHDGRLGRLGSFERETEAARAYDRAARRLKGEAAKLNYPKRR